MKTHQTWMQLAISEARQAGIAGDVPVGAVIVSPTDQVIAIGSNRRERDQDPTAHAEIIALRQAGMTLGRWHLDQCRLYVTLEPCPMCAGAIAQARIETVIYGADDLKAGALRSVLNLYQSPAIFHTPKVVGGICEQECQNLLTSWFQQLRM